ncbi:heavy metal translocating P-type ATPase [Mesonia aestuariivivens]|uniref:Heavy metal translocating P-type ATPase metal-binding domain-containing protein n=1 Tax=Mesonia aestuariivivens TaxID=2796128 RepID=A0ABS6W2N9_9FLAO|nr:heavy metal translocating P-type ATPase metal-binding domain-containing protein [Mesonia aestuariivivens]MBW2962079.1 heavy metal translocating P-type ATPase metal-binding domain-containing protein [Mesonia aestuariivivens]
MQQPCYHCGNDCVKSPILFDEKNFCCHGCQTVYEIFSTNNLSSYYDLQSSPGAIPQEIEGKYDYLDHPDIIKKLIEFNAGNIQVVNLYIPHMHCSSCIWILENLNQLQSAIKTSQVNFPKKTVRITFKTDTVSLKEVVKLLSAIGYEPYISLNDYSKGKKKVDRSLIYKLGVAGFAFGNVMFLSFPEYFEVSDFWLEKYKYLFRGLTFAFSLPVVFYAAQEYFISAYKGVRSKILNIDVPIALGISVLFLRSTYEVLTNTGSGFFDSLTGLVFFLLLGKFFQQKTYSFLSFERDYKSYFPIAVTKISKIEGGVEEENIQVYKIKKGDRLLIRNAELLPVDSILISGNGQIDYSFVTGESETVAKNSGDQLFAGGKQLAGAIEVEAIKSVEQSYLTQLWSNAVFSKDREQGFVGLINTISKHFTWAVLSIAVVATSYWLMVDSSLAINVLTSVLIIACPCALALATPFALGNMLRIFGKQKFYLKNANVIEKIARIDTLIFDKTGTITTNKKASIAYEGMPLSNEEASLLKNTLRSSNHPLSRALYDFLAEQDIQTLDDFQEITGKGMHAIKANKSIAVGSAKFVGNETETETLATAVHVKTGNHYKGKYVFHNQYRKGVKELFQQLKKGFHLMILSGDNQGEKKYLQQLLPLGTDMLFHQKPEDKLNYIHTLQKEGRKVMMVGDGLNDAGALAQSEVGISIAENVNVFSPACDAILEAGQFQQIGAFIQAAKQTVGIIKSSIVLSFIYNVIGLYFAVTGQLSPIIAAILMPLSSITVLVFVTVLTNLKGRKLFKKL